MLLGPWEFWCRGGRVGNAFPLLHPSLTFSSLAGEVLGSDSPLSGRWPDIPVSQSLRQEGQNFEATASYKGRFFLMHTNSSLPQCGVCLGLALCSGFGPGILFCWVWALSSGFGFSTLSASLNQPWLHIPLFLGPLAVKKQDKTNPQTSCFFNFPFWLVTMSSPSPSESSAPRNDFSITALRWLWWRQVPMHSTHSFPLFVWLLREALGLFPVPWRVSPTKLLLNTFVIVEGCLLIICISESILPFKHFVASVLIKKKSCYKDSMYFLTLNM